MSRWLIPLAGVLTFVLVYGGLQLLAQRPAPVPSAVVAPTALPGGSLREQLEPGQVALGLPLGAAEPLLRDVKPGARLNVLASMPEPDTQQPLSAVVARGARVLQPVRGGEPLVVEVSPSAAVVLAHLVLGGTPLSYAVWPADTAPVEVAPLDERTARAVLGLAPRTTPTALPTLPPPAPPTSTPAPAPTPAPTPSPVPAPPTLSPRTSIADRYVVQPGDTLASIAAQVGIDLERMRAANPNVPDTEPLPAGMQLVVPQDG